MEPVPASGLLGIAEVDEGVQSHLAEERLTAPGVVVPLDFATVAAYEESYFPWEGGGLLGREVPTMPTFVTLAKWTDEGIRNIKDSPKRRHAFEDRITSMGGKVKDAYLVMGEYDLVVVTEVPNDETAAKMALGTAMQGNVRTMTMRAFGREEMDKIVGSLP
jgi:uncharacterized protein with GYD domain